MLEGQYGTKNVVRINFVLPLFSAWNFGNQAAAKSLAVAASNHNTLTTCESAGVANNNIEIFTSRSKLQGKT